MAFLFILLSFFRNLLLSRLGKRLEAMKILIISTSDKEGGAAIAAARLTSALYSSGVDVRMLVMHAETPDGLLGEICDTPLKKWEQRIVFYLERAEIYLRNGRDRGKLFHVSTARWGFDLNSHPLVEWADIIHLHWINQGFLSLKGLAGLSRKGKPVVWTLHDLWPATAICHHPRDCNRFAQEPACGYCPQINSHRENDLSRQIAQQKKRVFVSLQPIIVGCSHWIKERAATSSLLSTSNFYSIPNPIDTGFFHPIPREKARAELALEVTSPASYFLLFGAVRAHDYRKGIGELSRTLHILYKTKPEIRDHLKLLVFGQFTEEAAALLPPFQTFVLGYLSADRMLRVYNAADLFVTPSLEENLPNTIMEAMACGTPSLGFATGGIPEMINDDNLGHVSPYRSSEDMAEYIYNHWRLCRTPDGQPTAFALQQRRACRQSAKDRYDSSVVADLYKGLYDSLLE
ncbi:glycosyl transferase, group 1 family protein [Porphyromonas crevioricanis JCM 15906]|uniref:Glycosyl transferase, group 1 family protein n=2 Tax=Porphyromonas crevioricanis TaxID=393921 RepID=T1CQ91_9PORP|nr:glycosyl transferase, group 1 family protein [Porphyromonas crevioricanis JCM 15906]GAD07399.1 glycosyl transferase, group 1 family protein [Porphyromonas crevioricanis JCM 13913]